MKKVIQALLSALIIVSLSSLNVDQTENFIGTYGASNTNELLIKLTINSNNTFQYQDFSNSENKISILGTWSQKGKKIFLKNNDPTKKFHQVWTFHENGKVAKSRKGLLFYRLCKIEI